MRRNIMVDRLYKAQWLELEHGPDDGSHLLCWDDRWGIAWVAELGGESLGDPVRVIGSARLLPVGPGVARWVPVPEGEPHGDPVSSRERAVLQLIAHHYGDPLLLECSLPTPY